MCQEYAGRKVCVSLICFSYYMSIDILYICAETHGACWLADSIGEVTCEGQIKQPLCPAGILVIFGYRENEIQISILHVRLLAKMEAFLFENRDLQLIDLRSSLYCTHDDLIQQSGRTDCVSV